MQKVMPKVPRKSSIDAVSLVDGKYSLAIVAAMMP